ncbi:hypothetical protein [Nitrosospira briensis]|uniref:hypothetical protein n=1 Tax=Nitrosospira briensis TaxID=35799 RepID=UPI000469875B|nr:hypothetical protein [Nitrosospira briensis]
MFDEKEKVLKKCNTEACSHSVFRHGSRFLEFPGIYAVLVEMVLDACYGRQYSPGRARTLQYCITDIHYSKSGSWRSLFSLFFTQRHG